MFNQGNNNNNMYVQSTSERATNNIKKLYNELDYPIDVFFSLQMDESKRNETERNRTEQMI